MDAGHTELKLKSEKKVSFDRELAYNNTDDIFLNFLFDSNLVNFI